MWQKSARLSPVLGFVLMSPSAAWGEANPCATAYEQAQELRSEQRLREAQHTLESCVAPTCSEFVRTECGRWLVEVEASLPSVVLAAKKGGRELEAVRVLYDGKPLVQVLDGKAVPVDPGPHTLTFESPGVEPIQMKLVFREGEKNRLITAQIEEASASAGPSPLVAESPAMQPATDKPGSWLPYGFGGLGVLGIAGFAVLGMIGNSELKERERSCAPTCTDSDVNSVKTKYYLADASLGVGVVSLGVAGYLLLTAPQSTQRHASFLPGSSLDMRLDRNGGYASMRVAF
ncbi:MAG TPA: hypothetical protein VKP30_03185 [Polyangiaceae bacterium]|nr:hypothetical protein [Polyangiaceae bacterium]